MDNRVIKENQVQWEQSVQKASQVRSDELVCQAIPAQIIVDLKVIQRIIYEYKLKLIFSKETYVAYKSFRN